MKAGYEGPAVVHSWRCTRRGPFTETIVTTAHGPASLIVRCEECNGTDHTDDQLDHCCPDDGPSAA